MNSKELQMEAESTAPCLLKVVVVQGNMQEEKVTSHEVGSNEAQTFPLTNPHILKYFYYMLFDYFGKVNQFSEQEQYAGF